MTGFFVAFRLALLSPGSFLFIFARCSKLKQVATLFFQIETNPPGFAPIFQTKRLNLYGIFRRDLFSIAEWIGFFIHASPKKRPFYEKNIGFSQFCFICIIIYPNRDGRPQKGTLTGPHHARGAPSSP